VILTAVGVDRRALPFLKFTPYGQAMRAVAQDADAAALQA